MKRIIGLMTMIMLSVAIMLFAPQVFAATAPANHWAASGIDQYPYPGIHGSPVPDQPTCMVDHGETKLDTSQSFSWNNDSPDYGNKLTSTCRGEGRVMPPKSFDREDTPGSWSY